MPTVIREAAAGDIPRLVAMGHDFLETVYVGRLAENPAQMAATARRLIEEDGGLLLVAENAEGLVAMFGMLIFPHFLSAELTAAELFWWVDPGSRGIGLRLLKQAERWAIARGVARVQMIAPSADVEKLYERLGYVRIETAYQRSVHHA